MNKLSRISPKLKTLDDAAAAERLVALFHDAIDGAKRMISFGLHAHEVKLLQLKHTQFGPWVQAHVEPLPRAPKYKTLRTHMKLAESVIEFCAKEPMTKVLSKLAACGQFAHCGELLLLPEEKIPAEVKPLREKIFDCIDCKSSRALMAEFVQVEEDPVTGELKPKRGRLKGQGGATKEQRDAAQLEAAAAEKELLESETHNTIAWLLHNSDASRLGLIDDTLFEQLVDSTVQFLDWAGQVKRARKQARKGGDQ